MRVEKKHICYVLQDVGVHHPIAHYKHELVWYPERAMTLFDCIDYKPLIKSIVTENPHLIACYDNNDVRVWDRNQWIRPYIQTYGLEINQVLSALLGWKNTIPSCPLDGGILLGKLRRKIQDERGMADATYHRKRKTRSGTL